jgi:CHAT domain-containing protein
MAPGRSGKSAFHLASFLLFFTMRGLVRFPHPPKLLGRLAIAVGLVMAALALGYASRSSAPPEARLASTLLAERFTTGRLLGQTAWSACVAVDTAALVPRHACGEPLEPRSRRFRRIEAAIRAVRQSPQPDSSTAALRGEALVDLRFAGTASAVLERAAQSLERAHRQAPDDAGLLNDLAVANLAVGERTQQLTPMLHALDAVERAVAADSLRPEILFNRALILQRLYLVASAERAWARYLAVERDPRWRAEAQAHARWVAQVPDTVSWGSLLRSPPGRFSAEWRARIALLVNSSPQAARDSSFVLLGAWGAAILTDSSERASSLLASVREIGAAADALGGDRSVSKAVAVIDVSAAQPAQLARLADGHVALANGYTRFYQPAYEQAAGLLQQAERSLRSAGSPAARWAAFYRATTDLNLGRYDSAEARLEHIFEEAPADELALAGRTFWARGVSQVRQGNYDNATRLYQQAAPYSGRAKEKDNRAAIAYLLAESLGLAGQSHASAAEGLSGLRLLSPYRRSNFLNNHLATVATLARGEGLSHAALAIRGEVLEVATVLGKPDVMARAYRARARDLIDSGRRDAALVDLTQALRWVDQLEGSSGKRVRGDVNLVLGQWLRPANPAAALALLTDVVEAYKEIGIGLHIPVALYEAGVTAEAAKGPTGARPLIQDAIEHLERQQASFQSTEARALFHETIENVFDVMIRLELAAGRPDSAFVYLERARAAIQPLPGQAAAPADRQPPMELRRLGATLPAGTLFVDYALLEDRLVIWTASRHGQRHRSVSIRRDTVAALVEQFRREAGESDARRSEVRGRLYDLLIRPLRQEMEGIQRLIVVPDRELYQLPFVALWDRQTQRYLVQFADVTTVPSATFHAAASAERAARAKHASALIVGNPALDATRTRWLPSLPNAVREAERVAALYPEHRLLTGDQAGLTSVRTLLPGYSIFHFAGHAVFNGEQPGSSYLALSSDGGSVDGRLSAWEIGELRLSNVRVVVLSACSTLSPRASRAGAATGLAYSFLRAGAPATVSTLWDVSDDATTPLLTEFHRRFSTGATPAQALRQAQIQALRSPRADLRSPAAWAAFIYTGP